MSLPYLREVRRAAEARLPAEVAPLLRAGSGRRGQRRRGRGGLAAAGASCRGCSWTSPHVDLATHLLGTTVRHAGRRRAHDAAARGPPRRRGRDGPGRRRRRRAHGRLEQRRVALRGDRGDRGLLVAADVRHRRPHAHAPTSSSAPLDAGAARDRADRGHPGGGAQGRRGTRSVWDVGRPGVAAAQLPGPRTAAEKARDLGPQDVAWLAGRFDVPVVVKGVLHPADARRARRRGRRARCGCPTTAGASSTARSRPADVLGEVAAEVGRTTGSRCTPTGASARGCDAAGGARARRRRGVPRASGPVGPRRRRAPTASAGVLDELAADLAEALHAGGSRRLVGGLARPAPRYHDGRSRTDSAAPRRAVIVATGPRFDPCRRGARNVFHVARERRDARPRGRAAGPEADPHH